MPSRINFQPDYNVAEITDASQVEALPIPLPYLQLKQANLLQPFERKLITKENFFNYYSHLQSIGFSDSAVEEIILGCVRYVPYMVFRSMLTLILQKVETDYSKQIVVWEFPDSGTSGDIIARSNIFKGFARRNQNNWRIGDVDMLSQMETSHNPIHIIFDDAIYKGNTIAAIRKDRKYTTLVAVPLVTRSGTERVLRTGVSGILTCSQIPIEPYAIEYQQRITGFVHDNYPYASHTVLLPHTISDTGYMLDFLITRDNYRKRAGFNRPFGFGSRNY
jgi:hypothetical protein